MGPSEPGVVREGFPEKVSEGLRRREMEAGVPGRGWSRQSQKAGQQTDVFLELKPVLRRERRWGSLSPDLRGSRTVGIEGISGTRQGLSVLHAGLCSVSRFFRNITVTASVTLEKLCNSVSLLHLINCS